MGTGGNGDRGVSPQASVWRSTTPTEPLYGTFRCDVAGPFSKEKVVRVVIIQETPPNGGVSFYLLCAGVYSLVLGAFAMLVRTTDRSALTYE